MKKCGFLWLLLTIVSVSLLVTGCDNFGRQKTFFGTQVYYTTAITEDEVDVLGAFLITEGFADGEVKTVQLNRTGRTYEFRAVVRSGFEQDPEIREMFEDVALALSEYVFNGAPVDVHLCDDRLQTLVVIPMPGTQSLSSGSSNVPSIGIRNQTGNTGLFLYVSPASSNDAGSDVLGNSMLYHGDSINCILPRPISVENTYNIRMVSSEWEVFMKQNMPVTQGGTITITSSDLYNSGPYFIATANLRLRSEPDTSNDGNIVTVIPQNSEVLYLDSGRRDTIGGITAPWVLVANLEGIAGWAFSGYLEGFNF